MEQGEEKEFPSELLIGTKSLIPITSTSSMPCIEIYHVQNTYKSIHYNLAFKGFK